MLFKSKLISIFFSKSIEAFSVVAFLFAMGGSGMRGMG
jgi:hypothetical protein